MLRYAPVRETYSLIERVLQVSVAYECARERFLKTGQGRHELRTLLSKFG